MFIVTDFSLFSSSLTVSKAVNIVKEKGFKKVVLADTNMSGVLTFYNAAIKNGLEPIIGVQALFEGVKYLFISHNSKGYSKLTEAETNGYTESLFHNEDITAVAIDIVQFNAKIYSKFGSLKQESKLIDQAINDQLESSTTLLPIRLGNISSNKDFYTAATMLAVGNKSTYEKEVADGNVHGQLIQDIDELKSSEDLKEIISKCVNDYKFGNPLPPFFKFGKEVGKEFGLTDPDNKTLFEELSWIGLQKRFGDKEIPQNYKERLVFEMNVINNMSFPGYFLIVWDFIAYAKSLNIPVGPGRGSAAGSLVAWSLEITNIDPMPYGLLFERFLNPERVNLPDVDLDFCQERREEVIQYVVEKYGYDNVAQVITFGTVAAKASIRDAARVLNAPLYLADKMAKMIPTKPGMKLSIAYEEAKEGWDKMFSEDFIAKKIWDKAVSIEGLKKNEGVHAAGLVISNDPIYNRAPLYNVNGTRVVGYEGGFLEDVDLVKYDFLGLKTLTVINNAVLDIEAQLNKKIDIWELDFHDPEVYKYISTGNTIGLFQIESEGMRDLAKRLQPSNFEEVTAMLALYRPGPMEAGMLDSFINRKHGREKVDYFFDSMEEALKPILEPTYGLIVYQEQVMKIVQVIAGFSLGEADLVRRAMGKKKVEEMERISSEFVTRASEKGYKAAEAKELFNLIEKFAGYGFNKSHSAAYALVCYYTAFLKKYFPDFFMAHLINSDYENLAKLELYIGECKRMGISISAPSVKECTVLFTPVANEDKIIFGLRAVKGVGTGAGIILKAIEKIGKNASLQELLISTQRNLKKEVSAAEKVVNKHTRTYASLEKKYQASFARVNELNSKIQSGSLLNKRDSTALEKHNTLLSDLTNSLNNEAEAKNLAEVTYNGLNAEFKAEQENGEAESKLNKRIMEALAEVGAFECYGLTRKTILDQMDLLLESSKIGSFVPTAEEFSLSEKMIFEEKRTGLIISDVFTKEQREILETLEIPEDMPLGVLVGKETRKKKNGSDYLQVKVLLPNGSIIEGSDFNNVCNRLNIGDYAQFILRINGQYTNIGKANNVTDKVLESYPRKMITKKVTVLDDTSNVEFNNIDKLEVYDLDGDLIATFSKRAG